MANIFPKASNWLTVKLVVAMVCVGSTAALGVTYYATQKYTRIGYQPTQPVPFDHSLHAGQLGIDCRYCHYGVEESSHSNVPTTQICMTCHNQVQLNSEKLKLVRDSWESGDSIEWVRIHKSPDYVYFNHAAHVNSGISCVECHGNIHEMEEVYHAESLSMGFCLECHRNPEEYIRPLEEVTNLDWTAGSSQEQRALGEQLVEAWKINPPEHCAGCHR